MNVLFDNAHARHPAKTAVVMLPGAGDRAEDFLKQGFVRELRNREIDVDVAAADASVDYYLSRELVVRLREAVIDPLRARGVQRIWLMGISLGGLGAVVYALKHAGDVEGLLLIAPYLAARGTVAKILAAGGLARWRPAADDADAADDTENELLNWLGVYDAANPRLPRIHLAYGTEDRFSPASHLLAERLPADRIVTLAGGHDWLTWLRLWGCLLDRNVFSSTYARRGDDV